MIDFKKRLENPTSDKPLNPIEIYDRLDRASDKGPLRPSQISVLKEWHQSRRDNRDIIIKLNTGQGKTLVGLLILQSKMNENEGSALYLCPNKFLVKQTVDQARQFGIQCVVAESELPVEFFDGKNILVTPIQKLFNGLSKFRLGTQSIKVPNIVIDDAHACIESIKDSYTIKLSCEKEPYKEIVELFSTSLEQQGAGTFSDIRRKEFNAFLPIPYWEWIDHNLDVVRILSKNVKDDAIKFSWPLIKDILKDCLCIVSGQSLEISPYRPPLQMFGTYDKAAHRIFMSATITDDSFLIKGLGLDEETIKNPLLFKKEKWSGEKMILIPSLLDSSLNNVEIVNEFAKRIENRKIGIVVICPSFESAKFWESAGAKVVTRENIDSSIESLKDGQCDYAIVVVNRYDGIDLPDNSCRILIINSKPYSEDLLDRYIEMCREGSDVISVKTARIIEQGLGRSVRGEKDYCVIILTGSDLIRCIRTKDARKYFSTQTRTQIEIGLEIASLSQEEIIDDTEPMKLLRGLISQCLKRDEGWKDYYSEKMNQVSRGWEKTMILNIFSTEMAAENKYYENKYEDAVNILQREFVNSPSLSNEEKGWYLQEMARYIYSVSKSRSNDIQISAHRHNRYLLKPKEGMVFSRIKLISQKRIENILEYIKTFNSYDELFLFIEEMLGNLRFGVRADTFEKSLNDLAKSLGFIGQRPEKEWKAGPDNLWALSDNNYLLFECKTEVSLKRADITKYESGQMNNAIAWFKRNYPGMKVKYILIIPARKLAEGAGFNEDVDIMREWKLNNLVKNVRNMYSEFKNLELSNILDSKIQEYLEIHHLAINEINEEYTEKPKT